MFYIPHHFKADIRLFLFFTLYIFLLSCWSDYLEIIGTKTGVFLMNFIIFPKWLLTNENALFSWISWFILFLLQKIIILAFDWSCFRYLTSNVLYSKLQIINGLINFLFLI